MKTLFSRSLIKARSLTRTFGRTARALVAATTGALLALPALADQYTVTGSGIISNSNPGSYPPAQFGLDGESVTFSFTYDDSQFSGPSNTGAFPNYTSNVPIPVTVVGSVTGPISVSPVTIANPNDYTFDQWNYRSGINGLVQANNWNGTAFGAPPFPANFATVNSLFVSQFAALWQPSNNVSFGKDAFGPGQTLQISNATWTVAASAPASQWVAQTGTGARHDSNIHFIDANTGWFTAGTKVRKTTNGGATWVEQNPGGFEGLTGIHFVDANTGWATGYYGTIFKTANGGSSWSAQAHPTGAHCWSVFALSSTQAWITGSSGMLGRTTNGTSWTGSENNPSGNPGYGMYDVYFTSPTTGYSVAGGDWSVKTVDGGVTWTRMNTGTTEQLLKVTFADTNTGWAVGANGTIIKTTNAGASWVAQTSGTTQSLNGVSFVNASTGWVVGGNGTILKTNNGGTTWTPEASGTTEYLSDVHFVDASNGWAVGQNNTVLKYGGSAPPSVTTVIDDKFDDGNIGTNTLGIGNGFVNGSQQPVSESGGFANFNAGGVSTEVIASNSANASNPFLASAAELTYTFGSIVAPSPSQRTRLWFGYRRTGPVGFVFYPGAIGTSFGSGRQGLYVSVFSQNVGEDGYTNQGNLVATDDSGVRTTLASWNWSNPADLSGLVVKLTTTATHYQLEFSGAPGGVPNFVFGAASGLISGMGTVSPSTAFDIGAMNQYFGGTGGQARLDSVLWRSGVPFTPPPTNAAPTDIALSSTTIDENNAPGATIGTLSATDADAGQTHTFSLVSGAGSTDNSAFTITGNSLTINDPADFETKSSYSIRIRATDSGVGNLTFEKQFTVNITDVSIPQAITFGPLGGKTFGDSDFTVSATGGASGQPVTFSIASGPATISGGTVTITGAGDVTVRASQAGSGEYTAAADVDQTFTVAKAPQTLTFTARSKAATTATLPLSATGGASSQPVTYFVVSGPGLLTGNSLSFTGEGDVVVRASRAGDGNYLDAADVLVTVTARVNTAPTAVDDAIAITSGDATVYALANDSDADGDEISYFGVSEPSVTINGRVLIVPPAYSGSFTYTLTDGFSESTATVSVTAEAQLVSTRWQGLLYDNAGGIGGWMQATKTTTGQIIASLKVGSAIGTAKFRIPTGGSTTAPTQVGTLTASEAADGRLSVEIAGLAGNLRTGRGSATAAQLNVAIASINSAIPGGASARVLVRGGGDVIIFGKLPDGRGFSAKSRIADNGTFVAYSAIAKTLPKSILAGEFTLANLAATDVTGELGWVMPPQASGLHKTGVTTILSANGCIYAPGVPLPNGAGTLSVEGGDLAAETSEANAISAGKPAATTLVPAWLVNSTKGTFTVYVKDPARLKRVAGTGVYLPKTNSAWGFFPGTTVGGRVKISVP